MIANIGILIFFISFIALLYNTLNENTKPILPLIGLFVSSLLILCFVPKEVGIGDIYIQKVIMENEDKVELIDSNKYFKDYRVNFGEFFFDFRLKADSYKGVLKYSLTTSQSKILKYFDIKYSDIDIDEYEILENYYKPFKEKYMVSF